MSFKPVTNAIRCRLFIKMAYQQVFGLFSILLIKIYLAESSVCNINPGDKNLKTVSSDVILILNCSSEIRGVQFDFVEWSINGKPIGKDGRVEQNSKKTWSALFLTNVTSDRDNFQCKLTKENYRSICDVTPGKPKVNKLPRFRTVEERDWPKIGDCSAKGGWPTPSVSWWRSGRMIHNNDHQATYWIIQDSQSLSVFKIRDVQGYHQGVYTCRADNMFGTATEDVTVRVKRVNFIKWPSNTESPILALEGKNILLECFCNKDGCNEVTAGSYWRYNNASLLESSRIKSSRKVTERDMSMKIEIRNVSKIDAGEYLCGINTSKGFAESKREIVVLNKDTLLLRVSNEVEADLYSSTFLKCRIIFPSVLRYRPKTFWIYNNTLITKASKGYKIKDDYARESLGKSNFSFPFDLIIPNVTSDEYGQYTCGVEYTVGQEKVKLVENVNLTTIKKDEELKDHRQPIEDKQEETPVVAISSITAGGIIVGFVVAYFAYRMCRSKRNTDEPFFEAAVDGQQFRYDVFVTFSSHDLNWVKKELIPLVEKHKLNYCIHDRDFEIGKPVVDNMAQSVYTSRKILAVMSQNYLSSKFCRGELEMALYRSTERGDSSVIVMRIDDVDLSKLPKALRNRTFLDYNDFTERKNWEERLIKHLKPPSFDKYSSENSEKSYTLLKNIEA